MMGVFVHYSFKYTLFLDFPIPKKPELYILFILLLIYYIIYSTLYMSKIHLVEKAIHRIEKNICFWQRLLLLHAKLRTLPILQKKKKVGAALGSLVSKSIGWNVQFIIYVVSMKLSCPPLICQGFELTFLKMRIFLKLNQIQPTTHSPIHPEFTMGL